MPNLRQNIITGEWVVIAPERAKRPEDFVIEKKEKTKEMPKDCPFCVPGPAYQTKIIETPNIYVIPNKFPSFIPEDAILEQGGDLYPSYKALGYHEVVILKNHLVDLQDISVAVMDELFYLYQERIKKHLQDAAVEYSMVIQNHGEDSGASIGHPHSQIFASSILPTYISREFKGAKKYFREHKNCVFCDLVKFEKEKAARIVLENNTYIAFCFFAARFPFEIWILPKNHQNYFEQIGKSLRIGLAQIMSSILKLLDRKLHDPAYNFFIHTSPPEEYGGKEFYHWHIEITPRLSKYGGYELGSGTIIDIVSPEKAAWFFNNDQMES